MKMKVLLTGMLAVMMVFAVACNKNGGSGGQKDQVTLEMWHTYSDQEEIVFNEQVLPKFEEETGIKVNSVRMPYDGLKQQVIAGVSGDAAPDLMRMDIVWVPEFAKLGALEEVSNKGGFDDIAKQVFEGSLATNSYEGKHFGLPLNTNTKVAVWNKAAMEKAGVKQVPQTMDELADAARKAKSAGLLGGIGIGGSGSWGSLPYFWSLGGKLTSDDYTQVDGYLNSPESIKAVETMLQWKNEGLTAPSLLGGEPGTWDGIKNDEYLMIDDGPWFFSILMNDENESRNVIDYTERSLIPAGPGGSRSVVGGENLVMFANSKHKEEAWTFMKWMLQEEAQVLMASTGMIPTNKQAAASEEVQKVPFIAEYTKQLETALPRTPVPNWAKMEEVYNISMEKIMRGEAQPADELNNAVKQIETILKE